MYDPNNIFAKIIRGELPAFKVYEDERALAFMDAMPQSEGHTLVVPKTKRAQSFRHRAGRARRTHQDDAARRKRRPQGVQSGRHAHHSVQRERPPARRSSTSTSTSCPCYEGVELKGHSRDFGPTRRCPRAARGAHPRRRLLLKDEDCEDRPRGARGSRGQRNETAARRDCPDATPYVISLILHVDIPTPCSP